MTLIDEYAVAHPELTLVDGDDECIAYSTPLRLDRALAIPGWMWTIELVWLAIKATSHSRIVEVGSFVGRSTRALADNTDGWVLSVDSFGGPGAPRWQTFRENMDGTPCSCWIGDHSIIRVGVTDPLPPYDMIFLDGGHTYDQVSRDLDTWMPHLAPGGLLCGHDFGISEGVSRAVTERCPTAKLAAMTTIWFVPPTETVNVQP